ncbi:hypothetical protein BDR05DRAFT_962961 [Suillus weaverae]|nr:hypothetical protein BDR05DRAFT_962961 [Suillus weaverae]
MGTTHHMDPKCNSRKRLLQLNGDHRRASDSCSLDLSMLSAQYCASRQSKRSLDTNSVQVEAPFTFTLCELTEL